MRVAGGVASRGPCSSSALRRASGRRGAARPKAVAAGGQPASSSAPAPSAVRYAALQNGSDVRGVALEGVEGQPVTLPTRAAYFVGQAFAAWLEERGTAAARGAPPGQRLKVVVGRDPRLSGGALAAALAAGIASGGAAVSDTGLATTPACFMACAIEGFRFDAGLMLTASHLPWNRNGIKFFTPDGGLDKADIRDILERAAALDDAAGGAVPEDPAPPSRVDFMPAYAAHLRNVIVDGVDDGETPLRGLRVCVDAGNGSGGFFATSVLAPLGADVEGSQFLEPDGNFPNHAPNPEEPAAMASAREATLACGADLGIVFDTDVDRSAVIGADGTEFNRNKLIALLSAIVLREQPGATVVTDSVTSNGLKTFIEARGGKHLRFKRGYKNVINKGLELNAEGVNTPLMIETSGHGAMAENYFLDDGAYLAVKIIIEAVRLRKEGGSLTEVLAELPQPKEEREIRLKLSGDNFKEDGAQVIDAFKEAALAGGVFEGWQLEEENHEGWRFNIPEGEGKRGWCLLRQSLHDPIIVLNAESDVEGGVEAILEPLRKWLPSQSFQTLDSSPLAGC